MSSSTHILDFGYVGTGEDNRYWNMYDTVKCADWLGDQDAIEPMCRKTAPAVPEQEPLGGNNLARRR